MKKGPYVGVDEAAGCGGIGSTTPMSPGLNWLSLQSPLASHLSLVLQTVAGLLWEDKGGGCTDLSNECSCKQLPTSP